MSLFETLAAAYFVALAIAAAVSPHASRRVAVAVISASAVLLVAALAYGAPGPVRAWAPHVYLVLGYWLPALLAQRPSSPTGFEQWLVGSDRALCARMPALPAWLGHLVELAYLVCYPLVPIAFAVVWLRGGAADVDRFWTAILIAGYSCYASLPWLVSRPPRLACSSLPAPSHLRTLNVHVLRRVGHELNTFPSGHVAVAFAAAGAAAVVSPIAGTLIGAVAAAIAVGAIAGKYHYVVDVILGVAVGAIAVVVASVLVD